MVRLDTNEIAIVGQVGIDNPDSVQLKILFDSTGTQLETPQIVNLDADQNKRIISEVDPFIKGVEVIDYL
jgi:hypothetical protein